MPYALGNNNIKIFSYNLQLAATFRHKMCTKIMYLE